ncbi:MAG: RrF2 family transcriptional regulator, partial [Candidatus Binatia bacterium]
SDASEPMFAYEDREVPEMERVVVAPKGARLRSADVGVGRLPAAPTEKVNSLGEDGVAALKELARRLRSEESRPRSHSLLDLFGLECVNIEAHMKVGSKGYYGLLAMADLVQNYKGHQPVQVKEIARRQKIPEEYLGQIMVLLKRANLVHGTRGPAGGYYLARPPESITVNDVLKILEGPLMGVDLRGQRNRLASSLVARRLIETWTRAAEASEKILEEVTLADLCRPDDRVQMYYI